ncbi:plasmid partitioning protein RepB C-terminal domain-containing protein [Paraburkholderia pallida]|uniref:Chromosome partitioning protein ParB n=1 Tax=Paraburkholderia pallida TaxID=2547399 RepID=A0A4P7CJT9_9BURK|nr:plasmid partitioning protein RepB C-terminal domain-containing protein [Paraburkholderia pallida]QBQ95908.1 chromosome partitioning protein ParB [Paraburkholderia pallida]
MNTVALGFIPEPLAVPITNILPSKRLSAGALASRKFRQIKSSIDEVGMIEPLSVTAADPTSGHHVLLDGHLRLAALQDLGFETASCLVATDDESYTFNNRVNRLSTIQEHHMIHRAVERGVSPERLAKALAVDVSLILKKIALLDGICAEAVELLKDRQFSPELVRALRKMKPTRQVECVELMTAANNLSVSYAESLLVATPTSLLVDGKKPRKLTGIGPEQMAKMEREMSNLQGQYKLVEQTYGQDVLNLVLAKGYLARLLENASVHQYLKIQQVDVLAEFQAIVDTIALDQSALEAST